MTNTLCAKCSSPLNSDQSVCSNCGHHMGTQATIKIDSSFDQLHENNPFRQELYKKDKDVYLQFQDPKTYSPPSDYTNTTNQMNRVMGTIKTDVHVVEEILSRRDLRNEGLILLLLNLTIVVIVQIVSIMLLPNHIEVVSVPGVILDILIRNFVAGFFFIYSIPLIGRLIGYTKPDLKNADVVRVLSYAYLAATIPKILSFYIGVTQSNILAFVWVMATLYYLIVFSFAIRRSMHKGYIASLVTLILAIILLNIYHRGAGKLIEFLFDGSFIFSKA